MRGSGVERFRGREVERSLLPRRHSSDRGPRQPFGCWGGKAGISKICRLSSAGWNLQNTPSFQRRLESPQPLLLSGDSRQPSRFCEPPELLERRQRGVHRSPFTVHCSPFTVHRSLFTVHAQFSINLCFSLSKKSCSSF